MGFYLFDHPPASPQFHPNRVTPWTGGVLIHTAENVMDDVGPDTGAENVASYISRRTTPGSYHVLVDSDSVVELLPATATAFHCAASGYNSTTVGVSYACRTVDLDPGSRWFQSATDLLAGTLVRMWRQHGHNPEAACRFIAAPDTRRMAGMSTHGEAQPVDRSDAWTRHPRRTELEAALVRAIRAAIGGQPPTPSEDEMKNRVVVDPRPGKSVWNVFGNTRHRLADWDEVNAQVFLGAEFIQVDPNDPEAVKGIVNYLRGCKDLGRPKGT